MKVAFFDVHSFEKGFFEAENASDHELFFIDAQLSVKTAPLALGYPVICPFVNDQINAPVLDVLAPAGLRLVAMRSAGYNNVDVQACARHNVRVMRVPAYSPYAVAEHALALILALNRKIHRAYARVREMNFSLDGLVGFDLHGKTIGVLGTGKIGSIFCQMMSGFGMRILAFDPLPNQELVDRYGVRYTGRDDLFRKSDIISLQLPLTEQTRYIINAKAISLMKPGVLIVNTGRGGLIDTRALVHGLKHKLIGGAGLDVYEEEEGIFFKDHSESGVNDDVLARLLTFPNVLITAHQAFLTREALQNIASTTIQNISDFEAGRPLAHEVKTAA